VVEAVSKAIEEVKKASEGESVDELKEKTKKQLRDAFAQDR